MYKKVGTVYSTTDYDSFEKLEGNRDVLERRKNLIKASIEERGWIRNPIIVNEKMQIIDGQGRFEALQELGMPIEYVISRGATIDDCIALNVKQKNWTNYDYISCYCEMGNSDYIKLAQIMNQYPNITDTAMCIIAGYDNYDGGGSKNIVRNGKFKIFDESTLKSRCDFAQKCLVIIGKNNGRIRTWALLLKFLYFCKKIDNELFIKKLEKYRAFIVPSVNIKQALECCEKIYNYARKKDYVYLLPEYDFWMKDFRDGATQ